MAGGADAGARAQKGLGLHALGPDAMPAELASSDAENSLQALVSNLPEPVAVQVRTLAHAWMLAGGQIQVGRISCRLLAPSARPFTAATLYADPTGIQGLELARVLLQHHGVAPQDWQAWCDERPELKEYGFVAGAKYPLVQLRPVPAPVLARLVEGLRDIAQMIQAK